MQIHKKQVEQFCSVAYTLIKLVDVIDVIYTTFFICGEQTVLIHHGFNVRMRENSVTYYINIH